MSVLAAIAVLAVLIVVHELGHFAAARLQGIRVSQFSIGFGPALVKYQGTETEYAMRAFPLGGYVGFPDDDPESEIPPDDPDLLRNRPILDRAIVISAGVIANLVFAYFLMVGQAATVGIPDVGPGVRVPEVLPGATAAISAGIQVGDNILAVNERTLADVPEAMTFLRDTIQASPAVLLDLTVQRGGETLHLKATPERDSEGKGKIGVKLAPNVIQERAPNLIAALTLGADAYQEIVSLTVQGFWHLLSHFQENARQVAGPVKIVEYGAAIARNDAGNLFQFAALISVNLAIINILPLPALDGGQLAFLAIEGLQGKPLPRKVQDGIMQTGLFLLLGFGMFLIVRDTANLAIIQELFQ